MARSKRTCGAPSHYATAYELKSTVRPFRRGAPLVHSLGHLGFLSCPKTGSTKRIPHCSLEASSEVFDQHKIGLRLLLRSQRPPAGARHIQLRIDRSNSLSETSQPAHFLVHEAVRSIASNSGSRAMKRPPSSPTDHQKVVRPLSNSTSGPPATGTCISS